MPYVDWLIKTRKIVVCNCDYGCPCEFMAPPTQGFCEGLEAMEIVEGHFGDTPLNGLKVAGLYRWPGPIHKGRGHYQVVIDQRADDDQRDALFAILGGKEQEPSTVFAIYGSTIEKEYDPIFADIAFDFDIAAAAGRFAVNGVMEAILSPIRNPVTNNAFRASIRLPMGFEYREAEMASVDFWGKGALAQDYTQRFGFLTTATYGPQGIVPEASYPQVTF
jgi:hypothetical protein